MAEPEDYNQIAKCANGIAEELNWVDDPEEEWARNEQEYLMDWVPFQTDECTCGHSGAEVVWHELWCHIFANPGLTPGWEAYVNLWDEVVEAVECHLRYMTDNLLPEEQAVVDAEIAELVAEEERNRGPAATPEGD